MRRHPGQVAFPGGMIEVSDSSPLAAASREAWEEIRLRLPPDVSATPLARIQTLSSDILIQPFWVHLATSPRLRRSPEEVAAILRVPLRDLLAAGSQRFVPHPRRPDEHTLAYVWRGEVIWGATAITLRELLDLVRSLPRSDRATLTISGS
jgi:8-oxo-dGTP pyrophosphatase MutT (NUDIX family)